MLVSKWALAAVFSAANLVALNSHGSAGPTGLLNLEKIGIQSEGQAADPSGIIDVKFNSGKHRSDKNRSSDDDDDDDDDDDPLNVRWWEPRTPAAAAGAGPLARARTVLAWRELARSCSCGRRCGWRRTCEGGAPSGSCGTARGLRGPTPASPPPCTHDRA